MFPFGIEPNTMGRSEKIFAAMWSLPASLDRHLAAAGQAILGVASRKEKQKNTRSLLLNCLFLGCAVLFSLVTVFAQVDELKLPFLQAGGDQLFRHTRVLEGKAATHSQYRILSEYPVELLIRAFNYLGIPEYIPAGFISFRIFQNIIIFLLASSYYKKLGLNSYVTLIGLSLLAWGMTHALYNSDLSFNTYSDIIFCLIAGILILHYQYGWIIPITAVAALNRETSGLIPLMLLAHRAWERQGWPEKRVIVIAGIALTLYACVFFGLRLIYGWRPMTVGYDSHAGIEALVYNISHWRVYVQFFLVMGILPFMALSSYRQWPCSLRAFFWGILPISIPIHLFLAIIVESRYFLVPLVLIFVPGTLFGIVCRENRVARGPAES